MPHSAAADRYEHAQFRRCGASGLDLPTLALGLWQNFGDVDPHEAARAIIHHAFDRGVTHFDLANNYGPPPGSAEAAFGRLLATDLKPYRDELVISTKAGYDMWPGPYGSWGSRKSLLASLDASLARLGLSDIEAGQRVMLAHGTEVWPQSPVALDLAPTPRDASLSDVAASAETSLWTVLRHRAGKPTRKAQAIDDALAQHDYQPGRADKHLSTRNALQLNKPVLDTALAHILGCFVGDGNVTKSGICITSGDGGFAEMLAARIECALGVKASLRPDHTRTGNRWRIEVHSQELLCLLAHIGVDLSAHARAKTVPDAVLRSPRPVVAAFLRGLFDADGYAGKAGVILSTSSGELARQVQVLLLNFGILSTQRRQAREIINLEIRGVSARRFDTEIGFDLDRKHDALHKYVTERCWFRRRGYDR